MQLVKFKVIRRPRRVPAEAPRVSIVIPVYNEEGLLHAAIVDLIERVEERFDWDYEIIISENGSTDRTIPIARALHVKYPRVKLVSDPEPNYGKALLKGIRAARGEFVICDEVDICDIDFYERAMKRLVGENYDLIVGSKLHPEARDPRPKFRHAASVVLNMLLRVLLGFRGTDTHGVKAFRRERMEQVLAACVVDRDLFASEFVIRAERMAVKVGEVPVEIVEKRTPSINLVKRVPNVFKNLARLYYVLNVKGRL